MIVTPTTDVNRTTRGSLYKVTRKDNGWFYIIDDWGIERQCYWSDFKIVEDDTRFIHWLLFSLIWSIFLFGTACFLGWFWSHVIN